MHKLRIGVIVNLDLHETEGGAYSYYTTLLNGINNYTFDEGIDVVNVVFYTKYVPEVKLKKDIVFIKGYFTNLSKTKLARSVSKNVKNTIKSFTIVKDFFKAIDKTNFNKIERALIDNKIDIIYHLTPDLAGLNYPFIATHWDLAHKSTYVFPETIMNGIHEAREYYYSNMLNKASFILCESEASVKELMYYYPLNPAKVKTLPLFSNSKLDAHIPSDICTRILNEYLITENEFFIYPAQFWALKNHYNLLIAFSEFIKEDKNKNFKLLLSGSDKGNLHYIQSIITEYNLTQSVIITGFVSNEVLAVFYKYATALVMPTFLGPTNMPIIEAAQLKCPVLCSNLTGHYEIMGENALYFAPDDPSAIQKAMEIITTDEGIRNQLIASAFEHICQSKFNLNRSLAALNTILLQLKPICKTWSVTSN